MRGSDPRSWLSGLRAPGSGLRVPGSRLRAQGYGLGIPALSPPLRPPPVSVPVVSDGGGSAAGRARSLQVSGTCVLLPIWAKSVPRLHIDESGGELGVCVCVCVCVEGAGSACDPVCEASGPHYTRGECNQHPPPPTPTHLYYSGHTNIGRGLFDLVVSMFVYPICCWCCCILVNVG